MKFIETKIPGVIVIEPTVIRDSRGYFFESFNYKKIEECIGDIIFVQDNESKSIKGVLRGLHFQRPPYEQAKLVRCIEGTVLDVTVDIRKGSPTYGKHIAIELSGQDKRQLFIPRGFAHGFIVLSEEAILAYKVDNYYAPNYESGIMWNDEDLAIDWKVKPEDILLSEKDKNLRKFKEITIN